MGELEKRFGAFETRVTDDLTTVKEAVVKWDIKYGSTDLHGDSVLHTINLKQLNEDVEEMKPKVEALNTFKWKAAGVISVVMIALQLFGGTIQRAVFPPVKPHTSIVQTNEIAVSSRTF